MLRSVFHLPMGTAQGLGGSILDLMALDLAVPHYTALCRGTADLGVDMVMVCGGSVRLVVDSTG